MLDISTPAIWYPGQSELDLHEETELMLLRAKATDAFWKGEIDADYFLNFLSEMGIDVFEAGEEWNLSDVIVV